MTPDNFVRRTPEKISVKHRGFLNAIRQVRGAVVAAGFIFAVAGLHGCGDPDGHRAPITRQNSNPNRVVIDSGTIEGVVDNGVLTFKGIPFAAPPVGALRWRPPQPVDSWQGVREAGASDFSPFPR